MKEELLDIHGQQLALGEEAIVKLRVGRLPSGNRIDIQGHVFRAKKPGPIVLFTAGIHGDEINGIEIVRRALSSGLFRRLRRGSVVAIPLLNVYGFINFSREVPDGKDVNRSFPGNASGSLASRVARALTKEVLPLIETGMDFHTGGTNHYNYPQLRYTRHDEACRALAERVGAPLLIGSRLIKGSLRHTAHKMGKHILVFEGGENQRLDGLAIYHGLEAMKRLLRAYDMLDEAAPVAARPAARVFEHSSWIRAKVPGIFEWTKCSGQPVVKDEPLGFIRQPDGSREQAIHSRHGGWIIGHNNSPVVNAGDALFHIGFESEK